MKLLIHFNSKKVGALGLPEGIYIEAVQGDVIDNGGLIDFLYGKFPDRQHFAIIKIQSFDGERIKLLTPEEITNLI